MDKKKLKQLTGAGYTAGLIKRFFSSVHAVLLNKRPKQSESFEDAKNLYQVDEQQLERKYHVYTIQGCFLFLVWLIFTIYLFFKWYGTSIVFELTYVLVDLVLLIYSLRALYFAHLIQERDLRIGFFSWLLSCFYHKQ